MAQKGSHQGAKAGEWNERAHDDATKMVSWTKGLKLRRRSWRVERKGSS